MSGRAVRPDALRLREIRAGEAELRGLFERSGVDPAGAAIMARKAVVRVIRIDDLSAPVANILKQLALAAGADCANHGRVILGEPERSTVHLVGHERQLRDLARRLAPQPFGLPHLGRAVTDLLDRLASPPRALALPGGPLSLEDGPRLMGIVNVTPDSFSDGGLWDDAGRAVEHGLRLADEGADLLDVGGESTRPGAAPVTPEEEARRVLPVIRELARRAGVPVSVDTRRAAVAREALDAGAVMVNDVTALGDPDMAPLVAAAGAACALMHMRGDPETMQDDPRYDDPVDEIHRWLGERAAAAMAAGIAPERLLVDPGIGFGKRVEDNTALIRRLGEFHSLGLPLLLGASRKSFLGALMDEPDPQRRLEGSLAAAARAVEQDVHVLRVHDVAATRRFLAAWRPLCEDAGAAAAAWSAPGEA